MDKLSKFARYLQTAEDSVGEMPDLQKHDEHFHPNGFNPANETCKFREKLEKGDRSDFLNAAETSVKPPDIEEANRRVNRDLDVLQAIKDKCESPADFYKEVNKVFPKGYSMSLGMPSGELKGLLPNAPINLRLKVLLNKQREEYKNRHPFDFSDIKDLVDNIQAPAFVLRNEGGNGGVRVFFPSGRFLMFCAVVSPQGEVNDVVTLFPKDIERIQGLFASISNGKGDVLACNKQKTEALLRRWYNTIPPEARSGLSLQSIQEKFGIVNGGSNEKEDLKKAQVKAQVVLDSIKGTVLGSAMWKDFDENESASLLGQEVRSPADLGALAQVFTNPSFETMRYFLVKDGKVVFQTGVTSRMPGSSSAMSYRIRRSDGKTVNATRAMMQYAAVWTEADGYYMLHNHPSGNPNPSDQDVELTRQMEERPPFGVPLLGHVVIDHGTYSVIDKFGNVTDHKMQDTDDGDAHQIELPHEVIGKPCASASEVAALGKAIMDGLEEKDAACIISTSDLKAHGLASIPLHELLSLDEEAINAKMKEFSLATSSNACFLLTKGWNAEDERKLQNLVRHKTFVDVIDMTRPSAEYNRDFSNLRSGVSPDKGLLQFNTPDRGGYGREVGTFFPDSGMEKNFRDSELENTIGEVQDTEDEDKAARRYLASVAEDVAPQTDMEKHDARFHPDGFDATKETCKFREGQEKGDKSDRIGDGKEDAKSRAKREYAEVVARYTNADGTKKDGWMKAPNGEPTNLTERQWVQVRTPSFKAWFGDWEHDPKHASKIVDWNGEPLVVYHGVGSRKDAGFTEFDSESRNSGDKGVFFADFDTASWYAPEGSRIVRHYQEYDEDGNQLPLDNTDEWGNPESIYACFLNIRNPKKYNYYGKGSCQGYRGRETPGYYAENLPPRNDGMVCENIKDLGGWRDGMPGGIAREDEFWDNTVYWVRDPKQIKSATDNTGVFSPHRTSVLDEKPTQDEKPMNLKKIASLALAEDAAAIANSDKVGKWVAFPHSRYFDKVAQITKVLYDADIDAPCFVYSGEHGAYIMKQNQVDAFFDSREEAEKFYEQENAKPSAFAKYSAAKPYQATSGRTQSLQGWDESESDFVLTANSDNSEGTERCAGGASSVDVGQGGEPERASRWARIRKPKKPQGVFAGPAVEHHHGTQTPGDDLSGGIPQASAVGGCQRKHNFKRDSDGNVLFHAPDFETPVTVEDADMRKSAKYTAVFAEDGRPETKVMLTSDIHSTDLDTLDPKDADIVVIAGDLMGAGTDSDNAGREYLEKKFCPWCEKHSDKEIVLTAGNHDKFLFRQWEKGEPVKWPKNVHYLVDRGATINGLKFYGTPWCLKNRPGRFEGTEESNREKYRKIPEGLDVLITHSPPYVPGKEVDANEDGIHEGSKELTEVILEKKPKLVVCGHVHSGSRKPVTLGESEVVNVARVKRDRSKEAVRPVYREVSHAQDSAPMCEAGFEKFLENSGAFS